MTKIYAFKENILVHNKNISLIENNKTPYETITKSNLNNKINYLKGYTSEKVALSYSAFIRRSGSSVSKESASSLVVRFMYTPPFSCAVFSSQK